MSGHGLSESRGERGHAHTDYILQTGYLSGRKVASLESVRGAAMAIADDYASDGDHDVAFAFRLFADSLADEPPPAVSAVTQHEQP